MIISSATIGVLKIPRGSFGSVIAAGKAAPELNELRERWLNPPEWLDPLAARLDAVDSFADVPADARPQALPENY